VHWGKEERRGRRVGENRGRRKGDVSGKGKEEEVQGEREESSAY
jgi:hypothetical protein